MRPSVDMLLTPKHIDEASRDLYGAAMARSVEYKTRFFLPMIKQLLPSDEECRILDLGSCTSSLAIELAHQLPGNYGFFECDLDFHFLESGREKTRAIPKFTNRFTHIQANAVQLPIASESMDAVMHSSFFHEIYSFPVTSAGPFKKENCHRLVEEIRRVLKPGGYALGRDYVARPDNPEEPLILEADQTNGLVIEDIETLLKAPVEHLSSYSTALRFLHQFEPAQNAPIAFNNGNFILPAWLASELYFHFSYRASDMWESEIHEHYGASSIEELKAMATRHGFESILCESASHYDIGINTGMKLTDSAGNSIDTKSRFPTNNYIVWKKKGMS